MHAAVCSALLEDEPSSSLPALQNPAVSPSCLQKPAPILPLSGEPLVAYIKHVPAWLCSRPILILNTLGSIVRGVFGRAVGRLWLSCSDASRSSGRFFEMLCLLLVHTSTVLSYSASSSFPDDNHFLFMKAFSFVVMAITDSSKGRKIVPDFGLSAKANTIQ